MTQTKHSLVIWLKQEKILNFWNWALKIIFYFTKSWLARNIVGSPKANVCDRNSLILFRVRFLRAARGWENSCFKFSNLGLTLGLALKFYTSVVRWLKLKVKNVFEIYSNFCRSYRGKTGREPLAGLILCYWSFLNSMLRAILCADGVYICKSWHNKIKKKGPLSCRSWKTISWMIYKRIIDRESRWLVTVFSGKRNFAARMLQEVFQSHG